MTRDIRLTDMEIVTLRDLCQKRTRDLEKRLERSSYDGKPGMKDAVLTELSRVRELAATMEHARQQIARQFAERIRETQNPDREPFPVYEEIPSDPEHPGYRP